MVDLRVGFLADCGDGHRKSLRPCRVEQQERDPPVARNEAEFHGYRMIPRWLRSMKSATIFASSPSNSRIFSSAWEVFNRDASKSLNAFCSRFSRSGVKP